MESCDSSPEYTRSTGNSDANKENSPGESACDDTISLSISTNGSAINGLPDLYRDNGIKNRSNNKKTLKNFRNLKTFRRRSRSRAVDQISMDMSDDVVSPLLKSSLEVSDEWPHYMRATSSSKGKKANSQESYQNSEFDFDNSDRSPHSLQSNVGSSSVRSLQTPSTALNVRNVKILIKKTSFKPKRSSLKHSQVSEDVHVDRATCSSTLKDSKFAKRVEHVPGEIESEKISLMKVCRYHHCFLHGHSNETHNAVPPQKRFLYKRRRSLKKQKSMKSKSVSRPATRSYSDERRDLQKGQKSSYVQPLVQGQSDDIAVSYVNNEGDSSSLCQLKAKMTETPCLSASNFVDSETEINAKPKPQIFGDGFSSIQESDLVEMAFGETSYPEESYQESLKRAIIYNTQEQGILCLKCSCIKTESNESKITAYAHLPQHQVSDGHNHQTPQNGVGEFSDACSSSISLKLDEQISAQNKDTATSNEGERDFKLSDRQNALTPDNCDEVPESNNVISSDSACPNPKSEGKLAIEVTSAGDSESHQVMQVKDSEVNTPVDEENKPQFSKGRHFNMWNLIHQHMAESMAAESENKLLQSVDGSNVLPAKDSSTLCRDFSDSPMGILNNNCETQDIEVRKLLAVKLVREAIEKILLPEVQDQTSDDQSTTSDSAHERELFEKNQDEGCVQESSRECEPGKEEGNPTSNLKEADLTDTDISGQVIVQADKKVGSKSEKQVLKHWSNLKKWILLQRFIRELEKVRKFNPRSPHHLPLKPDPESEKVNLRRQMVEERKKAEEWMLDYAIRQAVDQLAPTQKKKVALLVKAFETVVIPNEDNTQKFAGIGRKMDESLPHGKGTVKDAQEIIELNSDSGETTVEQKLEGIQEDRFGNIESKDPDHGSHESKHLILDGNGISTEDNISSAVQCDILELETTIIGEANRVAVPKFGGFQEDAKSNSKEPEINNGTHNIQLERQNNIRMWHAIYQHVVSGIAAKVGSQLLDGTDEEEVEDCNELPEISNGDYFPKSDDDLGKENRVSSHLRSAFTKTDAVKLVQEAVDEILLPEIQDDSSDAQSVASDFSPDQEILEINHYEVGEQNTLKSANLNQEKETRCTTHEGGIPVDQEGQRLKSTKTPQPLKSKNWSKLKKLILLKRSIKALEKARKLNPRLPQKISLLPDPQQEKADLRHQMMDERIKAEQWMLDYAVQHIVTKLTPARKRRVAMLVEAFEAVVPLPELSTL